MSEQNSLVAVCIVTHNSAPDLPACLEAVAAQTHRPVEVVVADCASTDGSAAVAHANICSGVRMQVVELGENLGFAGGMNAAIAKATAPFVLTLNADARPAPDYVAGLLHRMENHPELRVGAVTGRLVRPREAGRAAFLDACGMRLTLTWRHLDRGSGAPDRGQFARVERVFGCTGAASLFRRAALEDCAIEGEIFDSVFHSFREDAELCFRLRERGWQVLYEPAATCVHRRFNLPQRRSRMPAAVNFHSLKNRYLLRFYHQTAGNFWWTALPAIGRDGLALVYALIREPESLRAYSWLWRHRRRIWRRRQAIQGRRLAPARVIDRWFWRGGEAV